jgi:2OG-Fe(II) oxygenase superfamily
MRGVLVVDDAFSGDELAALRNGAITSPFLSESPLKGTFEATRGFAVTFRRPALDDVMGRFSFLAPFFRAALDRAHHKRAQRRPPLFPVVEPNAFYLNLLVVPPGASVGEHIDATLSPPHEPDALIPVAVGVTYVQVPAGARGGLLSLENGKGERTVVEPREGRFVLFAGHLLHSVSPLEASAPRISWVLEQYALDGESLARVPALRVHSRAGFGAFLKAAQVRSGG